MGRGGAEGLGGGALGGAEVAVAAGAEAVGGVAEVLDEGGHAALGGFGVGDHAVDLAAAEGELLVVAGAPGLDVAVCSVARTLPSKSMAAAPCEASFSTARLKVSTIHPEALAEDVGHLEFVGEEGGYPDEFGGGGVVALEEEVVHLAVGEGVEEDGAGGLAVASGAADLLVVGLDGAGEGDVDDGADVGLVDAHAEGDGGYDYFEFADEEVALDSLAGGGVEAGVVGGGFGAEGGGQLFGGFAGGGVDDGGAVLGFAEEVGGELVAAGLGELDDLDGEVVAAEAVDEEGGVGELELGDDVFLDGGGGGGGEGEDGGWA